MVSFLQTTTSTADATSYTFSAQNLGEVHSQRYIIVTLASRKAGVTQGSIVVTIGGIPATVIVQRWNSITNTNMVGIAIAKVPTGTTGDIVVEFGVTMIRCTIGVYRTVGINPAAYDFDSAIGTDPSVSLGVPANGFAIGVGGAASSGSATWVGLTENFDSVVESAYTVTGASKEFTVAESGLTITIDFTVTTEPVGVFASWYGASSTRYLLNGIGIPRPTFMAREFIFTKTDMETINGRTARDFSSVKEKFILRWDYISQDEMDTLMGLIELNTSLTFQIAENNLVVNETSVIPFIDARHYPTPGGSYFEAVELELVEVS